MYRDPKAFRDRFNRWKEGKPVYQAGRPLPAYDEGGDFESFKKTLPDNLSAPGAYNMERYWQLNDKPKSFGEGIGKGMFSYQPDGWHAGSVAYNDQTDTYEFMKPNYHPTRWMEQVYGYDKNPEFQKDWKVEYNGPMLSDRYVRREKPGLKTIGGQLPKLSGGKDKTPMPTYNIGSNLISVPMINTVEKNSETVHNILSWLPWVGTAMDVRDAINGDNNAIVPAMIGAVADTVGFRMLRKGYQATKAFKNAVKNKVNTVDAYRLMQDANRKTKQSLAGAATYLTDWYSNMLQILNDK